MYRGWERLIFPAIGPVESTQMRIGYFGGTFDPIHRGHLAAAQAAATACKLQRVLFVPTEASPLKKRRAITPYIHRYAMTALALAELSDRRFAPSLLEEPEFRSRSGRARVRYSIDTVRAFRRQLRKRDQLFFIVGADAFMGIARWHEPERLLRACEFVVVNRPGYSLADVADALPKSLRPRTIVSRNTSAASPRVLRLPGVTIHLVPEVRVPVSATDLRRALSAPAASSGRELKKMLPATVATYIFATGLYARRDGFK